MAGRRRLGSFERACGCGRTSSSGSTDVLAALTRLLVEALFLSIASVGGGAAGFLPGGGGNRCRTLARKASSPVCTYYCTQ